MAVTKIQRVKSVTHAVDYITSADKTEGDLIYSHNCTPEQVKRDFDSVLNDYNTAKSTNRELKPIMIIQSYDPDENITPEQAHKYGKEFAERYLKNDFQYVLATHHDTEHIHNHIVFNDINYKTLNVFDSSRENTLHRMRNENDLVSEKYGLKVINKTKSKHKYLTHKDYVARSKGISFKDQIEKDIDLSINENNSYESFLKDMESKGYDIKQGKHLAIKSPRAKRHIRTKSLGFNYLENSIKHRIKNKDYIAFKPKIITREWIDKNQTKFKNSKGLHRWATLQNINYLHELNNVLSKENISLQQFSKEKQAIENLDNKLESKLTRLDSQIYKLNSMADCFDVYKESYDLMIGYKKINTKAGKEEYKKNNFDKFKKYDVAKKNMNILKKTHYINNNKQLEKKIGMLVSERDLIYESVNLNKEKEQEKTIEKKQRRKDIEI